MAMATALAIDLDMGVAMALCLGNSATRYKCEWLGIPSK